MKLLQVSYQISLKNSFSWEISIWLQVILFWVTFWIRKFVLLPLNIDSTCFKNSKNPSCIDLLLTNLKPSFMKTNVFEICFWYIYHNRMISAIMKLHFTRESPKTKYYWDYRKFNFDYFSSGLSPFVLSKRMKTLKSYMNSVGFLELL